MLLDCLVDLTAPTGQAKRVRSSLSIYSKRRTRLFRKQKKKKKKKVFILNEDEFNDVWDSISVE